MIRFFGELMRRFYTVIFYLLIPFILIRLYWKGRYLPMYRSRIGERLSLGSSLDGSSVDVWVHAVSLGEVIAARPLISELLLKQKRILVTTMTPTGSQQVIKYFDKQVLHQYVPYDLPWAIRRFLKRYRPRLGIIMETELWPNLIFETTQANIPLLLANARLSDQSFKSYKRFRAFFKPILNQFTAIFTQTSEDSQKFLAVGASEQRVHMLGNIKFDGQGVTLDAPLPRLYQPHSERLKKQWGEDRTVFIAASTHDDEEYQLLSRLKQLTSAIPNLLLLIAPRHPERFQSVYELSLKEGFVTGLRSQEASIGPSSEVIVIDSLGELLEFYQCADYAFVGGSLVPIGGHNVLEPIAVGVPVFCGPDMANFKVICKDLIAKAALVMVQSADELVKALVLMHHNKTLRTQQINNASAVLLANRGTLGRYMEKIEALLSEEI